METIRILLVDDHEVVRLGLRSLLENRSGMVVIGEASTGREALRLAAELRPEVVVLDLRLPDRKGTEVCRELRAQSEPPQVLILSAFADESDAVAAVRAGAAGYLLKESGGGALLAAIETVARGEAVLDPRLVGRLFHLSEPVPLEQVGLSPRERDILRLMAKGLTNREVGQELFLGEGTVRNHITSIFAKLGVNNRAQAVAYALRNAIDKGSSSTE